MKVMTYLDDAHDLDIRLRPGAVSRRRTRHVWFSSSTQVLKVAVDCSSVEIVAI